MHIRRQACGLKLENPSGNGEDDHYMAGISRPAATGSNHQRSTSGQERLKRKLSEM